MFGRKIKTTSYEINEHLEKQLSSLLAAPTQISSTTPILTTNQMQQLLLYRTLKTVQSNKMELKKLHNTRQQAYWLINVLSVIMFVMGITLLFVPLLAALGGHVDRVDSLTAAGFGITNLAGLFLLNPIRRIHDLMGNMSQITLALNNFQIEADLRLMEIDFSKPETIDKTANRISAAAKKSIDMIQDYFEDKKEETSDSLSHPEPKITGSIPDSIQKSSNDDITLEISGTGFVPESVVKINGIKRDTEYTGSTKISAKIPCKDLASLGEEITVTVFNSPPGGGASNELKIKTVQ